MQDSNYSEDDLLLKEITSCLIPACILTRCSLLKNSGGSSPSKNKLKPGDLTNSDQLSSLKLDLVPQLSRKLTAKLYCQGVIYVDAIAECMHYTLQTSKEASETAYGKHKFKNLSQSNGVDTKSC